MIAFTGLSTQMIRLPNVPIARGKSVITAACWFKRTITFSTSDYSFWRHDRVLTPCQWSGSGALRPAFWNEDNSLLNVPPVINYPTQINQWTFCITQYNRTGIRAWSYVPGGSVTQGGTSITYGNGTTIAPIAINAMCIGGTEANGELAPSGTFLAELMLLRVPITLSAIPLLAQEPQAFADDLLFYAPLRGVAARTVPVNGRSFELQYASAARSLLSEGGHPPVEKWRNSTRVYIGDTLASRIRATDSLRISTSTNGSTLTVGIG